MSFFNYTSAGNQFSEELREGQRNVELFPWPGVPEGGTVGFIAASGQEFQGIYPATQIDPAPPDRYYRMPASDGSEGPVYTLAFVGTEYAVGATVEKTSRWISWSLDEILAARIGEVRAYRAEIMLENAQASLNPNWVIDISEGARLWHADVVNRLADRHARISLDGEPINYWARDVPVGGINKTSGNNQVFSLDRQQWTSVLNDISQHGFAATDAAGLVVDALEAEHAQGDRAGLVGVEIGHASWGWPPVYEGNGA